MSGSDEVEVRNSGIHGSGLFARREFRKGEVVLRWKLDQRIDDVAAVAPAERKFLHPLPDQTFVLLQAPERFVNHSCDNNTVVEELCDIATRDIQPGEEITSNYSADGAGQIFNCDCGAANCRKIIKPEVVVE